MFTGLIKETSQLENKISQTGGGCIFKITKPHSWESLEVGESISVNGVCLTLVKYDLKSLSFFVGEETLARSNFENLELGDKLNLEQSLRLGDRLGGHLVSGHVDGQAIVTKLEKRGACLWFQIAIPSRFSKWIVEKGSLAVDGVSLTINAVNRTELLADFFLIPETLDRTNLSCLKPQQAVNIECDQVVKIISEQVSRYGVQVEHHR